MRTDADQMVLREKLKYIGNGINEQGQRTHKFVVPDENVVESLDDAISFCFPPIIFDDPVSYPELMEKNGLMCPTNKAVHKINDQSTEKVKGDARAFPSMNEPLQPTDNAMTGFRSDFNMETIENETPSGLPPHMLRLKV